ncbi:MAG: helix-turn-helix transcriptional regulator [Clostridiales bacterium]|nr:helix-turn-helix transcriptional regulator [Clostridiales bacterium]
MTMKEDLNRLKIVLAEHKKTNKWLVDHLEKDPATVSKWCTNNTQPSLETLRDIANLLEIDIKELINSTRVSTPEVMYIKIKGYPNTSNYQS